MNLVVAKTRDLSVRTLGHLVDVDGVDLLLRHSLYDLGRLGLLFLPELSLMS